MRYCIECLHHKREKLQLKHAGYCEVKQKVKSNMNNAEKYPCFEKRSDYDHTQKAAHHAHTERAIHRSHG